MNFPIEKTDILERHSSVSAFDFLVRGVPRDAEDLIGVAPKLLRGTLLLRFRSVPRHSQISRRFLHREERRSPRNPLLIPPKTRRNSQTHELKFVPIISHQLRWEKVFTSAKAKPQRTRRRENLHAAVSWSLGGEDRERERKRQRGRENGGEIRCY